MNFPYNHHLYQTWDRTLISNADVILGLELTDLFAVVADVADLPVRTTSMKIKPTCTVISMNSMYNQGAGNYQDQQRFYEPAMAIAGDTEASLPYLIDAISRAMTSDRARRTARAPRTSATRSPNAAKRSRASRDRLGRIADQRRAHVRRDVGAREERRFLARLGNRFPSQWPQRLWDLDKFHHYNGDSGAIRRRLRHAGPPSVRRSPRATRAATRSTSKATAI